MAHDPNGLLQVAAGFPVNTCADPPIPNVQWKTVRTALFPTAPTVDQVRQGSLGDCFFLSAVISIVSRPAVTVEVNGVQRDISGAEYIERLMKDNGDGTVTIRFFSHSVNPQDMKKFTAGTLPKYYRIRKTILERTWSGAFRGASVPQAQGALWVKLLEKGFGAHLCKGNLTADYLKQVEGAWGAFALVQLLGSDTVNKDIATDTKALPWGGLQDPHLIMIEKFAKQSTPITDAVLRARMDWVRIAIFGGVDHAADRWWKFFGNHWSLFRKGGVFRYEDLVKIAEEKDMDLSLKADLFNYIDAGRLLPGKRGTGKYSAQQLKLFEDVSDALAQKRAVTAGTQQNVGAAVAGRGAAGEGLVKGLYGGHEYAVIDTRIDAAGLRWIQLRNPHGKTGRAYQQQDASLKAVPTEAGTFEIELADLSKRFKSLAISGTKVQL
jgi:hypothetical protein